MRFLEHIDLVEWCNARGWPLDEHERPAPDPRLLHRTRSLYATGKRSGREASVAMTALQHLPGWDECVLWVTLTGVWPSGEDWPAYYAMRGAQNERRSIDITPGHLFEAHEQHLLLQFLTAVFENAWDAHVLPSIGTHASSKRLQVSHDEWVEVLSTTPVEFDEPAD